MQLKSRRTSSGTRMYLIMLPRTNASGMRQNLSPSWDAVSRACGYLYGFNAADGAS